MLKMIQMADLKMTHSSRKLLKSMLQNYHWTAQLIISYRYYINPLNNFIFCIFSSVFLLSVCLAPAINSYDIHRIVDRSSIVGISRPHCMEN